MYELVHFGRYVGQDNVVVSLVSFGLLVCWCLVDKTMRLLDGGHLKLAPAAGSLSFHLPDFALLLGSLAVRILVLLLVVVVC